MNAWGRITIGCVLGALIISPVLARAAEPEAAIPAKSNLTVAVAGFTGTDEQTGQFIANTLLTDLGQSHYLHMVDRAQISQSMIQILMQPSALNSPQQIARIARFIGADRLVVGSYLTTGGTLMLNASLINVKNGGLVQGCSASVSGPLDHLTSVIEKLAEKFHMNTTGHALLENTGSSAVNTQPVTAPLTFTAPAAQTVPAAQPASGDAVTRGISCVLGAPDDTLTQQDMARVVAKISGGQQSLFTILSNQGTVSRVRALVAVVRALFPMSKRALSAAVSSANALPDADWVRPWAKPYVGVALDRGLWPSQQSLHPDMAATWSFVHDLLTRGNIQCISPDDASGTPPAPAQIIPISTTAQAANIAFYTGLIVDARGFGTERAMGMTVRDEAGDLIYPRHSHMPGPDFVDEYGTVRYAFHVVQATKAGAHPLEVRATAVHGDVLIISNSDAQLILSANARNHFLWDYKVSVLIDTGH